MSMAGGALLMRPGDPPQARPGFDRELWRKMLKSGVRLARPDAACPLPRSKSIRNVRYTLRQRDYAEVAKADTFLTSWATDGHLYSAYADGYVAAVNGERVSVVCGTEITRSEVTHTGNAVIIGNDPFDLRIQPLQPTELRHAWYPACYPSGVLVRNGTWFYSCHYRGWVQDHLGRELCYEQGPTRFRISGDLGRTWQWSRLDDRGSVVPETGRCAGAPPIKMGTTNFVDFGKNMEHSPDGYAYLVGHGTSDIDGASNWNTGDEMFLARVKPVPEAINRRPAFQYFAGMKDARTPIWSRNFSEIQPVVRWACRCGLPAITYFPALKKYVAVFCAGWPDGVGGQYDTWIAEADALWGPWSLVTYWDAFADQAYYAQIPSKFVKPDGRFVLFYSGGWPGPMPLPREWSKKPTISNLPNAKYTLCVAEFQLEL
jgi:hypothetical protein